LHCIDQPHFRIQRTIQQNLRKHCLGDSYVIVFFEAEGSVSRKIQYFLQAIRRSKTEIFTFAQIGLERTRTLTNQKQPTATCGGGTGAPTQWRSGALEAAWFQPSPTRAFRADVPPQRSIDVITMLPSDPGSRIEVMHGSVARAVGS
jgi:hypothetical protein